MDDINFANLVSEVNSNEKEGKTHSYSQFKIYVYPNTYRDERREPHLGQLPEVLAALNLCGWRPVSMQTLDARCTVIAAVLLERPLSSKP